MDWKMPGNEEVAERIGGERRQDRRYEMHLELRWRLIRRKRLLETGAGRTIDFSSGGVLFECGHDLPIGLNVELSVAWPMKLHNVSPLQLVVHGRVVRSGNGRAAIRTAQHEFRTAPAAPERRQMPSTPIRTSGMFLAAGSGLSALGKPH
jgi:hypothetical protein